MISHRDLLRAQARFLDQLATDKTEGTRFASVKAGEIMSSDVASIDAKAPAREAARIMLEQQIGCLPVVNGDVLVGIVTEADFLRWAYDALG
jgi:CBS domain-containing membrane protein